MLRAQFTIIVSLSLALLLACALLLGAFVAPRGERFQFIEMTYYHGDIRLPRIVVLDKSTGRVVRSYRVIRDGVSEQTPPWEANPSRVPTTAAAPNELAAQRGQ